MSDLTAIDILVDPDEDAVDRAREVNARVLRSMPGWVLDDTHEPHITMLQRYVRTDDLDQVYDAVEQTVAATDMASLSYEAVEITHADWGFPDLVDAVSPFVESGGTAAAFVTDRGEELSPTIIDRVDAFVPDQIGDGNYLPHITVGVARFDDLEVIEAEPFDAFAVHPSSVAVYHLGNNGTARKLLKAWPVTH